MMEADLLTHLCCITILRANTTPTPITIARSAFLERASISFDIEHRRSDAADLIPKITPYAVEMRTFLSANSAELGHLSGNNMVNLF